MASNIARASKTLANQSKSHRFTSQATSISSRCFSSSIDPSSSSASDEKKVLYDIVPKEDFGQYKEYSVIFTNRSLNLMSDPFQKVMRDLNTLLKTTYNASKVAILPG